MSILKRALSSSVFLCLGLLVSTTSLAATELLYVQEGLNIVTYSVNNTTAVSKQLGTLSLRSTVLTVRRSGSFLYVLGFTGAQESFTVYAVSPTGVPLAKPVQTLVVKPALTQFFIHPNGTFAYALYSWKDHHDGFVGDIVLFTINPKTGKLTNTTTPLANFPHNGGWRTFLYGFNSTGSKFYIRSYIATSGLYGNAFYSYVVNAKTGALSNEKSFWFDTTEGLNGNFSAISDELIGLAFNNGGGKAGISIYQNSANALNSNPLIACTSAMLSVCGDNSTLAFHPSGAYLFVSDSTTDEVPILYISLPVKKLEPSGASIPGNPSTIAFSPSGLLVYAVENSEILVYVFNPHTGLLTARTSIAAPGVGQILPAE